MIHTFKEFTFHLHHKLSSYTYVLQPLIHSWTAYQVSRSINFQYYIELCTRSASLVYTYIIIKMMSTMCVDSMGKKKICFFFLNV